MPLKAEISTPLQSAKETWEMGVLELGLIFVLSILSIYVIKGNFLMNFFGIEAYRIGMTSGVKIGWESVVGFLLVLPTIAAGMTIYRSRR